MISWRINVWQRMQYLLAQWRWRKSARNAINQRNGRKSASVNNGSSAVGEN